MKEGDVRKLKNFYLYFAYIGNNILLPPAKIAMSVWIFLFIRLLRNSQGATFIQIIIVFLFGLGFFCGIADMIYIINNKKYLNYKAKVLNRKMSRLRALMYEVDPAKYQMQYGFD